MPSKTALKREHTALQELGERMIGLEEEVLAGLPVDERLRDAISAAGSMSSRGALRRQKQLIGKLMRNADADAIRRALDALGADERHAKRVFADAERWRERLSSGDADAVTEFVALTSIDDEQLREAVLDVRTSQTDKQVKTNRRRLFRVVHDALVAHAQDVRISR